MTSSSVLGLRGISTVLGGYRALDRVDFMVDRGEVRGLIGSNGAGKSTLLNVVVGGGARRWIVEFLGAEMRGRCPLAARPTGDPRSSSK